MGGIWAEGCVWHKCQGQGGQGASSPRARRKHVHGHLRGHQSERPPTADSAGARLWECSPPGRGVWGLLRELRKFFSKHVMCEGQLQDDAAAGGGGTKRPDSHRPLCCMVSGILAPVKNWALGLPWWSSGSESAF